MNFKTQILISLLSTIILFSCSTSIENKTIGNGNEIEETTESQTNLNHKQKISQQSIQKFLQNFQIISLPLTLSKWEINKMCDDFPKYNDHSVDTLFASNNPYAFFYGMLPDTSNCYSLIYFLGGVQEIPPLLVTIDKSGRVISEEILFCSGCQASLLIKTCNSYFTIYENYEIHSIDSIETGDLDENFHLIDSTVSLVIHKKNGKIDKSGNIYFSEQVIID